MKTLVIKFLVSMALGLAGAAAYTVLYKQGIQQFIVFGVAATLVIFVALLFKKAVAFPSSLIEMFMIIAVVVISLFAAKILEGFVIQTFASDKVIIQLVGAITSRVVAVVLILPLCWWMFRSAKKTSNTKSV